MICIKIKCLLLVFDELKSVRGESFELCSEQKIGRTTLFSIFYYFKCKFKKARCDFN